MIRFFLPFSFLLLFITSNAQQRVSGRVLDLSTDAGLQGALISTKTDTTVSGSDGEFSLMIAVLPTQISVSHLGYKTTTTNLETTEPITIGLLPSSLTLNDIIISGSARRSIKNTPTSIQVINPEMLQRDAPFTISNAINRVPGVYMHSGALNTSRITIRGIGSRTLYGTNKVKAYFDEIPITDGSGNSSIEDIDQELIGRIEVIKGPNSSLYGAGLGGAIRLMSNTPASQQTSVKTGFTAGSFKTYRWLASVAHDTEKVAFRAVYSDFKSEGYRENSEFDRQQAGVYAKYRLSDQRSISFLGVYTDLKAFIPSSIGETAFLEDPQSAAFTWDQSRGFESYQKSLFGVTYADQFKSGWELKSTVFLQYRDAYEPRPFSILDELTLATGLRATVSRRWERLRLIAGTELFRDGYEWQTLENNYTETSNGSVEGELLSDNEEIRRYANTFAEANMEILPLLNVSLGASLNYTWYDLDDQFNVGESDQSGTYTFDPVLAPKLGITYELGMHNTAFANISHGFSPPSLEETLYPDGQVNPNIQPETGWNYEVGLRGNLENFNYDLTTYYMEIKDLLVAQRTAQDQYVGVNAGLNQHTGVDLLANYYIEITENYTINFFNSAAFMHYRFADFVNDGEDYSGNALTGVPRWIFNTGAELMSSSGFYGNFNTHFVGAIPMNDANSQDTEEYLLMRAKFGYQLNLGDFELDANVGVNNLYDSRYASMILINAVGFGDSEPRYYYPGNPRNVFGGLTVKYMIR